MTPFTKATKSIKYLAMTDHTSERSVYDKNFKTMKKEMEEDLRKWKNLPCSWISKINNS